jgi:hypothetical protein
VLLLVAASLRADPPGVVERIRKEGEALRDSGTGQVFWVALPPSGTDDDLGVLCELRGLRALVLNGTQVTDDGLGAVAGLPRVKELTLRGGNFTDAGLRHLEAMRGLRLLRLWGCPNLTAEGVERLREALPYCITLHSP